MSQFSRGSASTTVFRPFCARDFRRKRKGEWERETYERKYAVLVRMLPPRMKTHYGQIYTQFL